MLETDSYAALEAAPIRERVVVSPATGRFRPLPPEIFTCEGEWVEQDQTLAVIHTGRSQVPVTSPFTGWMMGMLAMHGQPVTAGDQLFWIRP